MNSNGQLLLSTSNQWAATALLSFLKNAGTALNVIKSEINKGLFYASDKTFIRYFPDLPEGYAELSSDDIDQYRLAIETIILKFLDNTSISDVINYLTTALRTAIITAARVVNPVKEVNRPPTRPPIKSGLHIPKEFFKQLTPYVQFILNIVKQADLQSLYNINMNVYQTMLDIALRRPRQTGPEGMILSYISQLSKMSQQLLDLFQQISKIKDTPNIKIKFTFLVDSIKCIRFPSSSPQDIQNSANQLKEWVLLTVSLKGKWCLQNIISFVSETFIYFFKNTQQQAAVGDSFSLFSNFIFQNASSQPTEENFQQLFPLLIYMPAADFVSTAPKLSQLLVKNSNKLQLTIFFQHLKSLVDAAVIHKGVGPELFKLVINNWFLTMKDKSLQINPAYKDNSILIINTFPSVYQMASSETEEFLVKLIQSNQQFPNQDLLNFILSTIHYISVKTSSILSQPIYNLSSYIRSLIQKEDLQNDEMQLVVPLLPLFWKNVNETHGDIISLSTKLIKSHDITVLGGLATFFSDIMENQSSGMIPAELLVQFATQFINNFDVITNDNVLQRNFNFFHSFIKSFTTYLKKNKIDRTQWQKFVPPCETRMLTYALHQSIEIRAVVDNIWTILNDLIPANTKLTITLSQIYSAFEKLDKESLRVIQNQAVFPQKYQSISSCFINMEANSSIFGSNPSLSPTSSGNINISPASSMSTNTITFKKSVAEFLVLMFKTEYFNKPELTQNRDKLISALIPYFNVFQTKEVFNIISFSDPSSWVYFMQEITKHKECSLFDRLKYPWSISSHILFTKKIAENKTILESCLFLLYEFLTSELPIDESGRFTEILGAEFCSTVLLSISSIYNKNMHTSVPVFNDNQKIKNVRGAITSILRRLNPDSITVPFDTHFIFSFLELLHSLISTIKILNDNDLIEDILDWTLLIALKTKTKTLLQLKCHDVVRSLVMMNPESLSLIMRSCFRSSELTTTHAAAAIASAGVSGEDLSILALGLSSRPSILCRSIAAEIANEMAKKNFMQSAYVSAMKSSPFSPLVGLDPFFEEKLANYFSSSLNQESVQKLLLQLPPLLKTTASNPSAVQHFSLISSRLVVNSLQSVELLLRVTSIANFSDLTPIKPLIPIWDRLFKDVHVVTNNNNNTNTSNFNYFSVLQCILNFASSINKTNNLATACVAFFRSYLFLPVETINFLLSKLTVITDPNFSFNNFSPSSTELVVSGILAYILALEEDQEKFTICFIQKIHLLLVWSLFLQFNQTYENNLLPPLITSILHASSPNNDLRQFVKDPSECVAYAINLPYRSTNEMTLTQIIGMLDTLKNISKLTVEMFLDTIAKNVSSLSKGSSDFWLLFANYFQPRHSSAFLDTLISKAAQLDTNSVSTMLPILTGAVRQNADPTNIGGFVTVLVSVVSSTNDMHFLRTINQHLKLFVDTVLKSSDADMISSTFSTLIDEHGGEITIPIGAFNYLIQAESLSSVEYVETLTYLREISRLYSISGPSFSYMSAILFFFDSIRALDDETETAVDKLKVINRQDKMISSNSLELKVPDNYENLVSVISERWIQKIVVFVVNYVLSFIGKTYILSTALKERLFEIVSLFTGKWTKTDLLSQSDRIKMQFLVASCLLGADSNIAPKITEILKEIISFGTDKLEIDLISKIRKLRRGKGDMKFKCAASAEVAPLFIDPSIIRPINEVCDYLQSNILS